MSRDPQRGDAADALPPALPADLLAILRCPVSTLPLASAAEALLPGLMGRIGQQPLLVLRGE